MEEEKKGKVNIILIVIIVLLLGYSAYLTYDKFFSSKEKVNDSSETNNENNNVLKIYGYKNEYSGDVNACKEQDDFCNEVVVTLKTESNDAFIMDINNGNAYGSNEIDNENTYVLYFDNGIKVYKTASKTTKKVETSIPNDKLASYIKEYWGSNYISGGFVFSYKDNDDSEWFYYDIKNDEKRFTDYTNLSTVSSVDGSISYGTSYLYYNIYGSTSPESGYVQGRKDNKSYLLEVATGKEIIKRDILEESGTRYYLHGSAETKNGLIFAIETTPDPGGLFVNRALYTLDGKLLRKIEDNEIVKFSVYMNGGDVRIYSDKTVDVY